MDKVLNTMEKIPVEDTDIKDMMGNQQKIMTYSELKNYNSITDILPKNNDSIILLYEIEENSGHWVCIKRMNNKIYYFDSYGGAVDAPLKWSQENNNMLGQGEHYLTNLFNNSPLPVIVNKTKYQNINKPEITSCGLWCMCFIKSGLTTEEFKKYILSLKKKYKLTNDKLITMIMIKSTINKTI